MEIVRDSIKINSTPEKLFNWFENLIENYEKWHQDHIKAEWISKGTMEIGAIAYMEEILHGSIHKLKFKVTKLEQNRLIEYKILFPASILFPKGSFLIEPKDSSCIFTASIAVRFSSFFSKFAKDKVNAFKKHMKEEGENLKLLLE